MALRIKKSTKKRHLEEVYREPNKKIFIVCEGRRTEVKYFEGIRDNAKELGISDLLKVVILDKDAESRGTSDPEGLIKLANETKRKFRCNEEPMYNKFEIEYEESGIYDKKRDKFLMVIDRDRESFTNYQEFIDEFKDEFILGITNPCFELWLLLHIEDSVENIINPKYKEILKNAKVSANHTFISNIVSNELHMNTKTGMKFSKFKDKVHYAIKQEKNLEQGLYQLENAVGSNIGRIIEREMLS